MGLPAGLGASWCFKDETTYGVAPSLASGAVFYACDNDSLGLKKGPKQGTGIFKGSLAPRSSRRVVETYSVTGATPMELPERQFNPWLQRMLGSYGQSAATLTEDGSTGAYSATHALGDLFGHSFTAQKGVPAVDGTAVPYTYTGCKLQSWEISAALSAIAKFTPTIEGRNELAGSWKDPLNGSVPSLQAYTAPVTGTVFHWVGASLVYGGTPSTSGGVTTISGGSVAGNLKGSLSLKCTRPMDLERYSPDVAPFRNEPIQNAVTQVTGSFTVEFLSSLTYQAAFDADTPTCLALQFTAEPIGTGADVASLEFVIPNVRLEGESAKVAGADVITQAIPWTAFDDGVNNVLQATYWTLDSA